MHGLVSGIKTNVVISWGFPCCAALGCDLTIGLYLVLEQVLKALKYSNRMKVVPGSVVVKNWYQSHSYLNWYKLLIVITWQVLGFPPSYLYKLIFLSVK
jgi:hypothetical protein